MSKKTSMSKQNLNVNLNLNVRGLSTSATLAINERSRELEATGKKVYKLGLGQSPFPVPKPVEDALKQNAFQKDYLAVRGLWPLREAVANYYLRTQGLKRTGEEVLIGPGSKELLFLLQLVYYGDLVIPTPSWVSYFPQARIIGRQVQWVKTQEENGWRLSPEELEAICQLDPDRPRIVILNYPNNPTGSTYSTEKLKALAQVARKYKIVLLSDEIYGELHHQGQHVSIARFYPEGTIVSGGISKGFGAGGWRLGTFTFPKDLKWLADAMSNVASETYTATSAPIQYAAIKAYEGGEEIEAYLKQSRRVLKALGKKLTQILRDGGLTVPTPQGAFYLFPNFSNFKEQLATRNIHGSRAICQHLLEETGVASLPGSDFGRPEDELTLRMSYVNFDGRHALKAAGGKYADLDLDDTFLRKYCGEVLEAMEETVKWAKK